MPGAWLIRRSLNSGDFKSHACHKRVHDDASGLLVPAHRTQDCGGYTTVATPKSLIAGLAPRHHAFVIAAAVD